MNEISICRQNAGIMFDGSEQKVGIMFGGGGHNDMYINNNKED